MRDVKVATSVLVPKENVKFYVAYQSKTVINDVKRLKKENKAYDYTGHKKIASVVYLKTGEVILTNTSLETLTERMNSE